MREALRLRPYGRLTPADEGCIDDCYALNVTDETAWACYYSDFPLVRIHDGDIQVWRNDLARGARGLIVDDRRVVLFGGYRLTGRGPTLHVFHDTDWFQLSLTDICE